MAKSEQEHTLSRAEQMWITAEINQPGWNLFYGIALIIVAIGLVVSVFVASLAASATAISVGLAALIAVGGVLLGRMGVRRIVPLQRLRHSRGAQSTEPVEVTGVTATRNLSLRQVDGTPLVLRGPLPSTQGGEPAADALFHEGQATLQRFAEGNDLNEAPALLTFADGCHAIGYVSHS